MEAIREISRIARFHKNARKVFRSALNSVDPRTLIRKNVLVVNENRGFKVGSLDGPLYEARHNIYICGFGKAVAPMAAQLQEILRPDVQCGVISVPSGFSELCEKRGEFKWLPDYPIEVMEGAANNIPDENSLKAAERIVKLAESLSETDILFVLISGGGSALAPSPKPPLALAEKGEIIKHLSKAGATIQELNTVRICLSSLKGGRLLQHTKARVISLILSDIVDSPLELIAGGPTVRSAVNGQDAIEILEKYRWQPSESLRDIILNEVEANGFSPVANHVIGSNKVALEAAKMSALSLGLHTIVATARLTGEARDVAEKIVKIADGQLSGLKLSRDVENELKNLPKDHPICVLFGGETTVKVVGNGRGGRNLEVALAAGIALEKQTRDVVFLSAGTDGIDGPTDAAGAVVDQNFVAFKRGKGFNAEDYLNNNDSYGYFNPPEFGASTEEFYAILKPGQTGTNVMDIQVLLFQSDG